MAKTGKVRLYFQAEPEFVDVLQTLADGLGVSRAAVTVMCAHIGSRWLSAVVQPESMFTAELLGNMKQAGVFDDE